MQPGDETCSGTTYARPRRWLAWVLGVALIVTTAGLMRLVALPLWSYKQWETSAACVDRATTDVLKSAVDQLMEKHPRALGEWDFEVTGREVTADALVYDGKSDELYLSIAVLFEAPDRFELGYREVTIVNRGGTATIGVARRLEERLAQEGVEVELMSMPEVSKETFENTEAPASNDGNGSVVKLRSP